MNQSVNDNNAKKNATKSIGDLNATHKKKLLQEHINELSQNVQRKMQPVTSISAQIDKAALKKLDEEFPALISETNILNEQVKKLSVIKITTIQERYEIANKEVP